MFRFNEWTCDPEALLVSSEHAKHRLEPRVMAVLVLLLKNPNRVLSADYLLDEGWQGAVVGDNALHRAIAVIRKALGDNSRSPRYVESVPRKGYRFIAPVRSIDEPDPTSLGLVEIAVSLVDGRDLINAHSVEWTLARYLRWRSASFRVLERVDPESSAGYELSVAIERIHGELSWSWSLSNLRDGTRVYVDQHVSDINLSDEQYRGVGEMIGEHTADELLRHKLMGLRQKTDWQELSYWERLIFADRYRSMNVDQIASRDEMIRQALIMQPQLPFAYAAKAEFLSWEVANGIAADTKQAIAEIEESCDIALEIDPNELYTILRCGTALSRIRQHDRGVALTSRAVELFPSLTAFEYHGMALTFAGRPQEAVLVNNRILQMLPRGKVYHYGRIAIPYLQLGQYANAGPYINLAVTHFPKDYICWLLLANQQAIEGDVATARETFDKAVELFPSLSLEGAKKGLRMTYGRDAQQYANLVAGLEVF